ncbi:MAG: PQQ-binding-like beta-propeller repeat protein [bacterium]|nr:PQQ-binding-like beta-propeller repeat protein [bacterium]
MVMKGVALGKLIAGVRSRFVYAGVGLLTLGIVVLTGCASWGARPVEDFACLHLTDIHVNPHLLRSGEPGPLRGGETIAWLCREAAKPQDLPALENALPPPEFALATGDLTEYGVIDDTWDVFEDAFAPLPIPLYVLPGNHDNTWVAMYEVMRARHGGENYTFDHGGCRFLCISSASGQEPVPSIDAKTRAWLMSVLERTPSHQPIFLALHHPLHSSEFASPIERDTLVDMLRDHNVALILYGHGHGVEHRDHGGIPGVMGGSTFGKNAGYGVLSVRKGTLRYAYRYHKGDPRTPVDERNGPVWRSVYEAPLRSAPPPRPIEIDSPTAGATVSGDEVTVQLARRDRPEAPGTLKVSLAVDGQPLADIPDAESDQTDVLLPTDGLTAGAHLLSAYASWEASPSDPATGPISDVRTRVFYVDRPEVEVIWRRHRAAAIKGGLLLVGELLIVTGNDGVVTALDRRSGHQRWSFATGAEILGTPAWSGELLAVGSGDGWVYALDAHGRERWKFHAGLPVYGWPLIDGDEVFIGDNGGRMHALTLATGELRWTFARADYGIESQPALWNDRVVFGAWDGYLYAVGRSDGELQWKSWGPKSAEGRAARYYAPADCGPVVVDDRLLVCDRGYVLASYTAEGDLEPTLATGISAIAPAPDNRSLFYRKLRDGCGLMAGDGKVLWESDVPAGRFPIPPTLRDGKIYVCSNRGLLSVLDAADGTMLWTYQVTPGSYVMASPAVDADGVCYVAGVDGSVTALRYRQNTRSTRQGM